MRRAAPWLAAALGLIAALIGAVVAGRGPVEAGLTLLEVRGDVAITGSDAQRREAAPGDSLRARDRVSTGAEARAVVGVGGDGRLDLGPGTTVEVTSVDRDAVDLELYGGRLSARVLPDSRSVRVAAGGRALAMTDARVDIGVDAEGALYAELEGGGAQLEGIPGVSALGPGERLVVPSGEEAEIGPIPAEFFLAVEWPARPRTRGEAVVVAGFTRPRAEVEITGGSEPIRLAAGRDGSFRATVPLREGENRVVVRAADALGDTAADEAELLRDSSGPSFSGDVEYRR